MYRFQNTLFALRRYVPGPLRQALKPVFRRWWQRSARRRLAAALAAAPAGLPAADQPAGYAILCFSTIDWELRFQRPQQLLTRLARRGHRVYYLRTDFSRGHALDPLEPLAPNVYGLRLPGASALSLYRGLPPEPVVQEWVRLLTDLLAREGVADGICLVQLPFWTPVALALGQALNWKVVYDCLDEHSGFAASSPALLEAEAALVAHSDLVLTTAELLYQKHAAHARQCVLLPNATDFNHFQAPPSGSGAPRWPRPVIGYYGALSEWLDVDWLVAAALGHPEWSLVIIGLNAGVDLRALEGLSNVYLLGERAYLDLPGFLHQFDVALIPFKLNALTRATNPVKFYEYLSSGTPVVATALPELMPHADLFYPASNQAEFISQLEAAVVERDPVRRAARVAFARQNDWEARRAQFEQAVAGLYGEAVIIIVSYGNREYLQLCLDSLWAKTDYPHYRVIVVDNDSGPQVVDYLRVEQARRPGLTVCYNTENLGFALAVNNGLKLAAGCEYVVLLNDDTVVTPGWLSGLLRHLQRDPGLGMVGPVTNWTSEGAQVIVGYEGLGQLDAFARRQALAHAGQTDFRPRLDMFCVALRRAVVEQVGPLDVSFGLGMFEDDDYALRLGQAGYRLGVAADVYIHHWGWSSFGRLSQADYDRLFETNRHYFEEKWQRRWQRPALKTRFG